MTAAERRALLGDAVVAQIHAEVAEAPAPTAELVRDLRRILARPARAKRRKPAPVPASHAA